MFSKLLILYIEIISKSKEDIVDGLHRCSFSFMHEPIKLYADGETAVHTEDAHKQLEALGIEVITRAP